MDTPDGGGRCIHERGIVSTRAVLSEDLPPQDRRCARNYTPSFSPSVNKFSRFHVLGQIQGSPNQSPINSRTGRLGGAENLTDGEILKIRIAGAMEPLDVVMAFRASRNGLVWRSLTLIFTPSPTAGIYPTVAIYYIYLK